MGEPSVVERVARIIDADAWEAIDDGRDQPGTLWHLRREWALGTAQAAILEFLRAIREPTPEAWQAGSQVIRNRYGHSFEPDAIWQAMIDTLLASLSKGTPE